MATHRLIQEIHAPLKDKCDLCATSKPSWFYRGRTPVERSIRDHHQVIDRWTESTWHVCAVCAIHVQNKNTRALLHRMNEGRRDLHITRRNARTIASFINQLQPGREHIGGTTT